MSQLSQNVPTISKRPNYLKTPQLTISKRPNYLGMSFLMWKVAERYEIHEVSGYLRKMLKAAGSSEK